MFSHSNNITVIGNGNNSSSNNKFIHKNPYEVEEDPRKNNINNDSSSPSPDVLRMSGSADPGINSTHSNTKIHTNTNIEKVNDNTATATTTSYSKLDVFVPDEGTIGGYSCKYCNTMPYSFRAPGSIW